MSETMVPGRDYCEWCGASGDGKCECKFREIDATRLSAASLAHLEMDVEGIAREEGCDFVEAERILLSRIGGQGNLDAYVACLVAGRTR